jgi:hypothetical protein
VSLWQTIGSIVILALGLAGTIAPIQIAKFVSIGPNGLTGISEIRATYGGIFLGLGLTSLLSNGSSIAFAIGTGFACAAIIRALSALFEQSRAAQNLGGIAFEGFIAALLLAGK